MIVNFERGKDPKEEMGIGIREALINAGIVFNKVVGESGFFAKEKSTAGSLNSFAFSPKDLRLIADFLEAHPECMIIPTIPTPQNDFVVKLDKWNKLRRAALKKIEDLKDTK